MRKIILTAVTAFIVAEPAFAADLSPRPAPFYAAPILQNWNGFYIGANAGGGIGNATSDFNVAGGPTFASVNNSLAGAVAGGQLGYNWQSGPMVYGLETDIQFSSAKGTLSTPCVPGLCGIALTASYSQEVSWFGTVRGRIGYASAGWLLYATAGYAYAQLETNGTATAGPATAGFSTTDFMNGWTAGGGIEVEFAPRWTAKAEYLYVDLGHANHSFAFTVLPTLNDSAHVTLNVVRAGVNFRFK
jgi:outer membrane immunogenic protein